MREYYYLLQEKSFLNSKNERNNEIFELIIKLTSFKRKCEISNKINALLTRLGIKECTTLACKTRNELTFSFQLDLFSSKQANFPLLKILKCLHKENILDIDHDKKTVDFYCHNGGDQILNEKNYSNELVAHLNDEKHMIKDFLSKAASNYTAILEVGCGKARNCKLALEFGLSYYGIDIAKKDIIQAREKVAKLCETHSSNMTYSIQNMSIHALNKKTTFIPPEEKVLVLFPFNVLGNVGNIYQIMTNLQLLGYSSLVSSYKTNADASIIRREYYENCGYKNVMEEQNVNGVGFCSDEGLYSIAFKKAYLKNICLAAGHAVRTKAFGKIGMLYELTSQSSDSNSVRTSNPSPHIL